MSFKTKLLYSGAALLGTALGISIHKNIKQRKQLKEANKTSKQLLGKIKKQEAELLQKRGNMHFVKNCLAIIKRFAEEAEECVNKNEKLETISTANRNTIQSIDLIQPLLEHLTYATNNLSSSLNDEFNHLGVFADFIKIRSDNNCDFKVDFNENIESYLDHRICCCIFTEILENAYKHSYLTDSDNTISINARMADDDYLVYEVSNPVYQSKNKSNSSSPSGMGLQNMRERLSLFYQNMYEISAKENNGRYEFKLIVKLMKN